MTKLSMIVAIDAANGIGYKNGLPWHIPSDLKYFKKVTEGTSYYHGYVYLYFSTCSAGKQATHSIVQK